MRESMYASADYDVVGENSGLTPSKKSATDSVNDLNNVQLSSTKLMKHLKEGKIIFYFPTRSFINMFFGYLVVFLPMLTYIGSFNHEQCLQILIL